jgi:hypothetical protein
MEVLLTQSRIKIIINHGHVGRGGEVGGLGGGFSIGAVGVQIFKKHWTFAKFLCDIRGLGVH